MARPELTELMARALQQLGASRAWVVHGADGLDELSTTGYSKVSECHGKVVQTFYVHPSDVGLPKAAADALRGGDAAHNAAIIRDVLAGETGPARDVVLLNAGAALLVCGNVASLRDGIARAAGAIDSGAARRTLEALVSATGPPHDGAAARPAGGHRGGHAPRSRDSSGGAAVCGPRRPRGGGAAARRPGVHRPPGPAGHREHHCRVQAAIAVARRAVTAVFAGRPGRAYERGGAAAISVLTEPSFFDGALAHLSAVRAAVAVPLLRKDFVVDEYQLLEAVTAGADAVLLIVSALAPADLVRLHAAASARGLAVLVEVHDEAELEVALGAGATIVGVNNRNLRTLEVDTLVSERLAARMPREVIGVSESGLGGAGEVARLQALGYRAFLIGERLMTSADPARELRALTGADVPV